MMYHTVIILSVIFCTATAAFIATAHNDALTTEARCDYRSCDQLCRRLGFPGGACVGDRCKCDNFVQFQALTSKASCDYQSCDQLCRRLGFPGGACVGDRCKCDNFVRFQALNEIDGEVTADQDVLRVDEKPDKHEISSIIVPLDGEMNIDQNVLESEGNMRSSVSRASCDCVSRDCDFYCFRLHYIGGICVTGQCRCYS